MNKLIGIANKINGVLQRNRFMFSKQEPKKQNPFYIKAKQNVIKQPIEEPVIEEEPYQRKVRFDHDQVLKQVIFANLALAGLIPIFEAANAAAMVINGGFMLSVLGHEIKEYLILVDNRHYEALKEFNVPIQYLKIVLGNMLFLSLEAVLLGFQYYPFTHFISIGWLSFNIYKKVIPDLYWILIFPILALIGFNIMSYSIRKIIFPRPIDLMAEIEDDKK